MSLHRVLLGLIAAVLLAALVPAGLLLERRLAGALEQRARDDLALMPRVWASRRASAMDGLMMHAKEIAAAPGLAEAVARGDRASAVRILEDARGDLGNAGLLITASFDTWAGPNPGRALVELTATGKMPVEIVADASGARTVALSPLHVSGRWVGAAGYVVELDRMEAALLAGLTRADVLIVTRAGKLAASNREAEDAAALLTGIGGLPTVDAENVVQEARVRGRRHLVASAAAGPEAAVLFVRDLDAELAVLPRLRRTALASAGGALVIAILLGGIFAGALARPARTLASAADRLAGGDFGAPLRRTRISEFRRVTDAFDAMRRALARRVAELESANRELADRQERLTQLQAELIRRDRLATAGQLVSQLAHEVRNPVANVRNCLELLRRRTTDPEARELTDLATDELLRMHELAERVLDLHRPAARSQQECDVAAIARNVAALARLGAPAQLAIHVTGQRSVTASMPPDTLKQVLMTVVQNAQEAMAGAGAIQLHVGASEINAVIEVTDTGPGIDEAALPRIFDPFFTTKAGVHGIGLGLFVAEGLIRSHGGRLVAGNVEPHGARFRLEVPLSQKPEPLAIQEETAHA